MQNNNFVLKLKVKHNVDIKLYGKYNELGLTGKNETSPPR
jgi:hypothetical protein